MSDRGPGTRAYLIDTVLIAGAGFLLAALLWDGPIFRGDGGPDRRADSAPPGSTQSPLADLLDAGCLTGAHLQALREGRDFDVNCALLPPQGQRPSP